MELLGKNLHSILVSVLAATFFLQKHRSCRSLIHNNCFEGNTLRWELKNLKQPWGLRVECVYLKSCY